MPVYDFKCVQCGHINTQKFDVDKVPDMMYCPVCEHDSLKRMLVKPIVNLRSGGFTGKNLKENSYRMRKSEYLQQKQIEQHKAMVPSLQPNVGGELCDSWNDAASLAKEKGKNVESYINFQRSLSKK